MSRKAPQRGAMKHDFRPARNILFTLGLLTALTVFLLGLGVSRVRADDMSTLLDLLIEKGILTEEEATAVREETVRREEAQKQEAQEAVAGLEKKVEKGVTAKWKNGFWIQSADGNFRFKPRGRIAFDFTGFDNDHPANVPDSSFFFRRARIGMEGYLYKYWKFVVEGDFSSGNSFTTRDAYIQARYWDEFHLTFGQYKVPFSREMMRSSKYLDTIERAIITNTVAPEYDPGIFATGKIIDGHVNYALGIFNGERRASFNNDNNYEISGRLNLKPFRQYKGSLLEKFEVGANVSFENDEGGSDVRLRPYGRASTRPSDIGRDRNLVGDKLLWGVDALWLYGPLSLQAEYLAIDHDNEGRTPADIAAGIRSESEADGFRITGTWLLTGEEKTQKRITPAENFNPFQGEYGRGAWELVVQYENADFDSINRAADNQVDAVTIGVNWWLNPFLRWSFNWVHENFDELPSGFRDDNADVYLSRLWLEW